MTTTNITNFAGTSILEIAHSKTATLGQFVTLSQWQGGMTFTHNMRPAQARQMAASLIAHADAVESESTEATAVTA